MREESASTSPSVLNRNNNSKKGQFFPTQDDFEIEQLFRLQLYSDKIDELFSDDPHYLESIAKGAEKSTKYLYPVAEPITLAQLTERVQALRKERREKAYQQLAKELFYWHSLQGKFDLSVRLLRCGGASFKLDKNAFQAEPNEFNVLEEAREILEAYQQQADRERVLWKGLGHCDKYIKHAECGGGHKLARLLKCKREWCPYCGSNGSDWHREKYARWLPKAQKLAEAGYLVITIPPSKRWLFTDVLFLRSFRRSVIEALIYLGYERGLSRWHWFGKDGPRVFHPHLNMILDCGWLPPEDLAKIKRLVARRLGVKPEELDIHYQYTRYPKRIRRWLWYITKATFRDVDWDRDMAAELYKFHNCHCWGKWDDLPDAWTLPERREEVLDVTKPKRGTCPVCGEGLEWMYDVGLKNELNEGYKDYTLGWLHHQEEEQISA